MKISKPRITIMFVAGSLTTAFFLACLPLSLLGAAAKAPTTSLPPSARIFIDKNCAGCHRSSSPPAGIDLTTLEFNLDDVDTFGRWVRVHDAVRDGKMPLGAKNLSATDREAFLSAITEPMTGHEQMRVSTRGRSVLRRLNRYEYENSIRDLLSAPWLQLKNALPEDGLIHRLNKSGWLSIFRTYRWRVTWKQRSRQSIWC